MNKKNLRKGFTTVELVIVIAIIAILATALIPTFGNLINKANETAALMEARQVYSDYLLKHTTTASTSTIYIKTSKNIYYVITDGQLDTKNPLSSATGTIIEASSITGTGFVCVGDHTNTTAYDATNHWTVCSTCGNTGTATAHIDWTNVADTNIQKCSGCDATKPQ